MKIKNIVFGSALYALAVYTQAQNTLAELNDRTPPEKVADLVWGSVFTTCGQSSYYTELRTGGHFISGPEMTIVEYKELHRLPIEAIQLSGADRANGFQYRAITRVSATAWRVSSARNPKGSEWSAKPVFAIRMTKRNGRWQFEADGQSGECGHECNVFSYGVVYSDLDDLRASVRLSNPKLSCSDFASTNPFRPKANAPPVFAFSGREGFDELSKKAEHYEELRAYLESIGRHPVMLSLCDRDDIKHSIAYDPLLGKGGTPDQSYSIDRQMLRDASRRSSGVCGEIGSSAADRRSNKRQVTLKMTQSRCGAAEGRVGPAILWSEIVGDYANHPHAKQQSCGVSRLNRAT